VNKSCSKRTIWASGTAETVLQNKPGLNEAARSLCWCQKCSRPNALLLHAEDTQRWKPATPTFKSCAIRKRRRCAAPILRRRFSTSCILNVKTSELGLTSHPTHHRVISGRKWQKENGSMYIYSKRPRSEH